MVKKFSFIFCLFTLLVVTSCNNIVNQVEDSSIGFTIGKDVSESISDVVLSNRSVTNDISFTVVCELLRGDNLISNVTKTTTLKELADVKFAFNSVKFENDYFVTLKVYLSDNLIYEGRSDTIILNDKNDNASVKLNIQTHLSSINYECNGGSLSSKLEYPIEYFINTDVEIPEPEREFYKFDGWYSSQNFSSENRVVRLGKDLFLGDVTLYAKWIRINQVNEVKISPTNGKFNIGDKIELSTQTEGASIYYTTNGNEPVEGVEGTNLYSSPIVITEEMGNTFVIKAIAVKEGMISSDVAIKEFAKQFTITYETGCDKKIAQKTVYYNYALTDAELSSSGLTKNGYAFSGWYVGDKEYNIGEKVLGDLVFTGKWMPVEYIINYHNCDSVDNIKNKTKFTIESSEITLENPIKPGYSFEGWYTEAEFTNSVTSIPAGSTGNKELYPKWKELPNVSSVSFTTTSSGNITLSWTNPTYSIGDSIVISREGFDDIILDTTKSTYTLSSRLTKGKIYIFTIKTENSKGEFSYGTEITVPLYALTETPINIDNNTVKFGDWPQSLKASNVTVSADSVNINNGWTCYYGNDGCYYVKKTVMTYSDSDNRNVGNTDYPKFPGETSSHEGEELYFKLEPIEWNIYNGNYCGGKSLIAKKAFMTGQFNTGTENNNNYADSQIRNQIKNKDTGIFAKAFTTEAKNNLLPNTEIGTDDYIFIPDYDEAPSNPPVTGYGYAEGIRWSWVMTRTPDSHNNNSMIKVKYSGNEQAANAISGRVCPGIIIK